MPVPVLVGKAQRFGTGCRTEIEFTEDIPAGTSVVGCFAAWYPAINPASIEDVHNIVQIELPFGGPWDYYEYDVGEGFSSNSYLYPPGNEFLPDPAWETFDFNSWSSDIIHTDLPYGYKVTDEAGNFYGWDGRDASEDFDEYGNFTDHYWNTRFDCWRSPRGPFSYTGPASYPLGGTLIWFSCHNVNGISAGQKLIIEHPGPMQAYYFNPGPNYLSYTALPGVFIAGAFKVDGISALPTNEKRGTYGGQDGVGKPYFFDGSPHWSDISSGGALLENCAGDHIDGFVNGNPHPCPWPTPSPSSTVPLSEDEWWWDLDSYFQGNPSSFLSGFPLTRKFLMFANLFGGVNEIDSVQDVSDATGLAQVMLYGTDTLETFSRTTRINFPDPNTVEDCPWSRLLEVRYHDLRNSDYDDGNGVYRTEAPFGSGGSDGFYSGIHDILIINQVTSAFRELWNDCYSLHVAYPLSKGDEIDAAMNRSKTIFWVFEVDDDTLTLVPWTLSSSGILSAGSDNPLVEGSCPCIHPLPNDWMMLSYVQEGVLKTSRWTGSQEIDVQDVSAGTKGDFVLDADGRGVWPVVFSDEWCVVVGTLQSDGKTWTFSSPVSMGLTDADTEIKGAIEQLPDRSFLFTHKVSGGGTRVARCVKLKNDGTGTWN